MRHSIDSKSGEAKIVPQSLEDLWALSKIISRGDIASGDSFRRFKSDSEAKGDSGERKKVFVSLKVESVEFAEESNALRIVGTIVSGFPEKFVPLGEHHAIEVEVSKTLLLKKENGFSFYEKSVLREAEKNSSKSSVLIAALDEHSATTGFLTSKGLKWGPEFECSASKRNPAEYEKRVQDYFSEILSFVSSQEFSHLIICGPGFAKDNFQKFLLQKRFSRKFFLEHSSNSERSGVIELLRRGVIEKILGEQKVQEEFSLLERLSESIAKDDKRSCYGMKDVQKAIDARAVETILVLDSFLRKNRELGELLSKAEKQGAKVVVFDSGDDAGKEFSSFKIAAVLRYPLFLSD